MLDASASFVACDRFELRAQTGQERRDALGDEPGIQSDAGERAAAALASFEQRTGIGAVHGTAG